MSTIDVYNILERLKKDDNDFRYMALSDLQQELQKETLELTAGRGKLLTNALLDAVVDNNSECRGLAVKCIALFSRKVSADALKTLFRVLFNLILKNEEEVIDISSLALKGILQTLPEERVNTILPMISPYIFDGLSCEKELPVFAVQEVLDILLEVLQRFGPAIHDKVWQERVLRLTLHQLHTLKMTIRKRASNCLGHLSLIMGTTLTREMMDELMKNADTTSRQTAYTYMYAISVICRFFAKRLGPFIPDLYELIKKHVGKYSGYTHFGDDPASPSVDDPEMDDLREVSLQTLEILVLLCSSEMEKYFEEILEICLNFVAYDPNIALDFMDADAEEDDDLMLLDGEEDGYSDDEDSTWKVRRGVARLIAALYSARPDMRGSMLLQYPRVTPAVLDRIAKEHEEIVTLELLKTIITILLQAKAALASGQNQDTISRILNDSVPQIVDVCLKTLLHKSENVRVDTILVLKALVECEKGVLEDHSEIIETVLKAITYKKRYDSVAIEVYEFLCVMIENHEPKAFKSHVTMITDDVLQSCLVSSYKLASESLLLLRSIIPLIREIGADTNMELREYLDRIADTLMSRLDKKMLAMIDQEIKDAALLAIARLLSTCGDLIPEKSQQCLLIVRDRVKNEISRVSAMKGLVEILTSSVTLDLSPLLDELIEQLCLFLRKTNRILLRNALDALRACLLNYSADITGKHVCRIIAESKELISPHDLHLTLIALELILAALKLEAVTPSVRSKIVSGVLPVLYDFVTKSAVQSQLLDVLRSVFKEIGDRSTVIALTRLVTKETQRENIETIASCIAALCLRDDAILEEIVEEFMGDLKMVMVQDGEKVATSLHTILLVLSTIASIGSVYDLSAYRELETMMIEAFNSPNDDVRASAASALGHMAVGNMQVYLGHILDVVKTDLDNRYLTLIALFELIGSVGKNPDAVVQLKEREREVIDVLFASCRGAKKEDEGTRSLVAECLSKFSSISPELLIQHFHGKRADEDAAVRATVMEAIKYVLTEKDQQIDAYLEKDLVEFLSALSDEDIFVRRCAIQALTYAAHNKFQFIREGLGTLLPPLIAATKVDDSLIRIVNLGPLRHKVDDGLDVRKSAFQCLYTILRSDPTCLNVNDVVDVCIRGFEDPHNDVKLKAHLIASYLAQVAPRSIIGSFSRFLTPLRKTLNFRVKEFAIKQEIESNEEVSLSLLRLLRAIEGIPNINTDCVEFPGFLSRTLKDQRLLAKWEMIKDETNSEI